jgi:hypothetical protein
MSDGAGQMRLDMLSRNGTDAFPHPLCPNSGNESPVFFSTLALRNKRTIGEGLREGGQEPAAATTRQYPSPLHMLHNVSARIHMVHR